MSFGGFTTKSPDKDRDQSSFRGQSYLDNPALSRSKLNRTAAKCNTVKKSCAYTVCAIIYSTPIYIRSLCKNHCRWLSNKDNNI